MRVSIASLRAAGISSELITLAIEIEEKETAAKVREQTRKRVQNHRSRNACNALQPLQRYTTVEINREKLATETGTLFAQESPTIESESVSKRGTRLSKDWNPTDPDHTWALQQGLSNEEIDHVTAEFRDYWIGVPGQRGCKLDWSATWRNSCRRFLNAPRRGVRPGKPKGSYAEHWKAQHGALEEQLRRGWG